MNKPEKLALALMALVLAGLALVFPDYARASLAMLLGAASFLIARQMFLILSGGNDA